MKVVPLNEMQFGAYVFDIDVSNMNEDETKKLLECVSQYKFVGIRDQSADLSKLDKFATFLGNPIDNIFVEPVPDHPYIIEVSRLPGEKSVYFGQGWHADFTFLPQPATHTILLGAEIPDHGGDTFFADNVRAYNSLDDEMKNFLATHTASHIAGSYLPGSSRSNAEFRELSSMKFKQLDNDCFDPKYLEPYSHPMMYKDPKSGVKAIYSNAYVQYIDGLPDEESKTMLKQLYKIQTNPQFVSTLKWYPNMIAVWDNRICIHKAPRDYTEKRIMYRMLIVEHSHLL